MEIILLWILLAYVVSLFARKRGRDQTPAFFVSLMLSPLIGLLIYAVAGESKKGMEKRILEEERIRHEARKKLKNN